MLTLTSTTGRGRAGSSRSLLGVAAVLLCSVMAACGSDSDSGGDGASEGDQQAVSDAEARLAPYLAEPTEIPVTTPLTSRPEEGKTLYLIRYNIPIAANLDAPHKEAADALGWNLEVLAVDPTDPLSQANAVEQAIAGGADFIEVSSGSAESIGTGIDAAKAAGIPIFLQAGSTAPEGEANGIYGNSNGDYVNELMMRLLDYAVVDSGGTGDILVMSAPDYPIVAAMNDYLEAEFPKNCEACNLEIENVSVPDMTAGKTPDLAIAAIRQNPDIGYIVMAVESAAVGLPEALKAAGLDTKILILGASDTQPPGLQDGTYAALAMQSEQAIGWNAVDMAARYSIGMDVGQAEHAVEPGWIWTKDNAPEGETGFAGPADFEEQYKTLWQVTS